MPSFKIAYNAHRYQDCSDRARIRYVHFGANDADDALSKAYEWRDRCASDGYRPRLMNGREGNRVYVGLIHANDVEQYA